MSQPTCELCGEPMPPGEEMFKLHGYSGPCPKPPLPKPDAQSEWRPIGTAPKTDPKSLKALAILAWCPDDCDEGGYIRVVWWEPLMRGGIWFSDRDSEEFPTLWQPLPSNPRQPSVQQTQTP